jgi:phospholipase C
MSGMMARIVAALAALAALLIAAQAQAQTRGIDKIERILVIYLENRSFDHLYGMFPGANGLANAAQAAAQTGLDGKPLATLPPVIFNGPDAPRLDQRFPQDLPNRPFDIDKYVPLAEKTGDLTHRFYQHRQQINGGRNDRFAAVSDAGALAMGYYDGSRTELWRWAQRFTLADNFFQAAFGGSFLNHMWLVCACTPRWPDAPAEMRAEVKNGWILKDGAYTPDGYAVNTAYSRIAPRPANANPMRLLPPLNNATIGDRLSAKGVSWAWYAGGWNDAAAGRPHALFQFHHQPFAYFAKYGEGTAGRAAYLKDEAEMLAAIDAGTLPQVAFWKPLGPENEHPGYADIPSGDRKVTEVLRKIEASALWPTIAVIVTYDEYGGFWDHVAPPKGDRWGPATRIPAIVISPFAKPDFVDHTVYDTTSILKFIEVRFGLRPLGPRDATANDLTNAFRF